uniref:Uncharacterized protein n=1 Tax=Otus sunia TaxID=257818 RepID=A0A8C8BKW1_9STRI
ARRRGPPDTSLLGSAPPSPPPGAASAGGGRVATEAALPARAPAQPEGRGARRGPQGPGGPAGARAPGGGSAPGAPAAPRGRAAPRGESAGRGRAGSGRRESSQKYTLRGCGSREQGLGCVVVFFSFFFFFFFSKNMAEAGTGFLEQLKSCIVWSWTYLWTLWFFIMLFLVYILRVPLKINDNLTTAFLSQHRCDTSWTVRARGDF